MNQISNDLDSENYKSLKNLCKEASAGLPQHKKVINGVRKREGS